MLKDLIDAALIIENVKATSKEEVLDEIIKAAVKAKMIPARKFAAVRKILQEREALGSTGIGNGVAVPHVKADEITKTNMILSRSAAGIPYSAVDGKDVHTLFMLLAPKDAVAEHLQALRWISTLARSSDFRRFVGNASGEAEIRDLLHEMCE